MAGEPWVVSGLRFESAAAQYVATTPAMELRLLVIGGNIGKRSKPRSRQEESFHSWRCQPGPTFVRYNHLANDSRPICKDTGSRCKLAAALHTSQDRPRITHISKVSASGQLSQEKSKIFVALS